MILWSVSGQTCGRWSPRLLPEQLPCPLLWMVPPRGELGLPTWQPEEAACVVEKQADAGCGISECMGWLEGLRSCHGGVPNPSRYAAAHVLGWVERCLGHVKTWINWLAVLLICWTSPLSCSQRPSVWFFWTLKSSWADAGFVMNETSVSLARWWVSLSCLLSSAAGLSSFTC